MKLKEQIIRIQNLMGVRLLNEQTGELFFKALRNAFEKGGDTELNSALKSAERSAESLGEKNLYSKIKSFKENPNKTNENFDTFINEIKNGKFSDDVLKKIFDQLPIKYISGLLTPAEVAEQTFKIIEKNNPEELQILKSIVSKINSPQSAKQVVTELSGHYKISETETKELIKLLNREKDLKEPKIFVFTKKTKTNEYINFKELDKPFKAEKGEKVILINKDNPNEKYEFTYKEDINQSKHRPNEAYIRIGGNLMKSSKFIRSCIEEAFPKDKYTWQKADEKYTEGLRGVYPISPQDDWSVLNFFDTNTWRQQSLYDMFLKSGQSNQREWLVNFLKSDSEALKKLITQQRNAIIKSSANEINAISLITNNYHVSKEYGLKSDRHGGIDAIDKNTGKTYQIKSIKSVEEKVDKTGKIISWEIKGLNSRLSDYKTKEDLNYLAYYIPEQKTVYVFKNQKYKVMNNDLVEHYEKPEIYK